MTNEAVRQCEVNNLTFGRTFRYQYVIAPENLNLPDMDIKQIGNQFAHIGPALHQKPLIDVNGQKFGLLLGVAADHDGNDPAVFIKNFVDSNSPDIFQIIEHYLVEISGRFAIIIHAQGETRLYVDAVGMIGVVYAEETKRVASSPLLTIDREVIPNPLYDHERIVSGKGGYGLNHTADAHIFRMNANHYMNLDTFTHQRFWPFPEDEFSVSPDEYNANYDEIIQATENIIISIASRFPTAMPITGGMDSRILFALAGDEGRSKISQFFTHITTYAARRDSAVASMLVGSKGLKHEVHDKKLHTKSWPFIQSAKQMWQVASGTDSPPPMEIQNGILQKVKKNAVVMRGHQTNIMRAQYFNPRRVERSSSYSWQIFIMKLAADESNPERASKNFRNELIALHEDLPSNVDPVRPDFIFYEALVPAALGVLFQGVNHVFLMSPFNSRRLVQLSMQFDLQHKVRNHATHDLILRADPASEGIPFTRDLNADLSESDAGIEERRQRLENTQKRYEQSLNITPPKVELLNMDLTYYHRNISQEPAEEKAQEE